MLDWNKKQQVIVYSMDREADTGLCRALKRTKGLKVRRVFTLDRAKVAKIRLTHSLAPRHIATSETILRRDLTGTTPHYFITLVPNNQNDWFKNEYLPATGIDVGDEPFLSREYTLGPARLLLVSAQAPHGTQEKIISDFLGRKITPLSKSPLHADARYKLLNNPFPFLPRNARVYIPRERSILYNAHQSLPFHTSGYATRTQGLVKALRAKDWDVQVVTRAGYPFDTQVLKSTFSVDGVPYRCDSSNDDYRTLRIDTYIERATAYLVAQTEDLRPHLIHTASNFMCALAGIEAARRLGVPSIYEMRGLWHLSACARDPLYKDSEQFALSQKLELEAAQHADHVIAITGALKDWLVVHGIDAGKISIAPNAADLERFAPRPPDIDFARARGCDGKIVIGFFGSFMAYEGLDILVQAVAMLSPALRSKIRLLWMGDGPALEPLLVAAHDLGITDCIVSLGRRPFTEVPRAYSITDIAVFPRKGLPVCEIIAPLKPFEAMAMGKPIIVSDVQPLQDIVTHGVTGLIHRKDDAADLSVQLVRLIEDGTLRMACGAAARNWVENTRSWERVAINVDDIYRMLT